MFFLIQSQGISVPKSGCIDGLSHNYYREKKHFFKNLEFQSPSNQYLDNHHKSQLL